jgi:hypothetical protein
VIKLFDKPIKWKDRNKFIIQSLDQDIEMLKTEIARMKKELVK